RRRAARSDLAVAADAGVSGLGRTRAADAVRGGAGRRSAIAAAHAAVTRPAAAASGRPTEWVESTAVIDGVHRTTIRGATARCAATPMSQTSRAPFENEPLVDDPQFGFGSPNSEQDAGYRRRIRQPVFGAPTGVTGPISGGSNVGDPSGNQGDLAMWGYTSSTPGQTPGQPLATNTAPTAGTAMGPAGAGNSLLHRLLRLSQPGARRPHRQRSARGWS